MWMIWIILLVVILILLCLLLVGFIKNKLKKNKELKLNKNEMEDFEDYKRYIVFNLYALYLLSQTNQNEDNENENNKITTLVNKLKDDFNFKKYIEKNPSDKYSISYIHMQQNNCEVWDKLLGEDIEFITNKYENYVAIPLYLDEYKEIEFRLKNEYKNL
ncbi:hypothetical protein MSATCC23557_3770 [Metamycoplasma salivarium]|nr:hypothetical protein MSATCC23557_3770 [Metamycoplasma salivarium]